MVGHRLIATAMALLATLSLAAQNYATGDTVTEYPNKGTFYHDKFVGRKTASGEIFDQNKFTAAHWKIKLGTYVMVTNRNNGMQVIVKVNDRCPKRGVFDLSHRAANAIGIRGMQPVNIRLLPEGYEDRWAAQEAMFDSVAVNQQYIRAHTDTPTKKESLEVKPEAKPTIEEPCNLLLGTATSHGEAYNMILKLPEFYQDKVIVESINDSILTLTLEVQLDRNRAEEMRRALQHSFPDIKVTQ